VPMKLGRLTPSGSPSCGARTHWRDTNLKRESISLSPTTEYGVLVALKEMVHSPSACGGPGTHTCEAHRIDVAMLGQSC
jgi:hypothetical protein